MIFLGNARIVIPDDWANHTQLRPFRIQVENSINWVKTYNVCSEQLREKIGGSETHILFVHNRYYYIGAGFTNYNILWNKAFMNIHM